MEEAELGVGVHVVSSLEQGKHTALSGCVRGMMRGSQMQGDQNTCLRGEIRSNLPFLGEGMAGAAGEARGMGEQASPIRTREGTMTGVAGRVSRGRVGTARGITEDSL